LKITEKKKTTKKRMFVPLEKFDDAWRIIVKDSSGLHPSSAAVVVLTAIDVDAICASKIIVVR